MQCFVTILICITPLVACATNPVTGRKQFIIVSKSQAIAASKQAYVQMLSPLQKEGKIDGDPALKVRIDKITGRLVAQAIRFRQGTAQWEWTVKVIDDPKTVNAFCMAGGRMAVYTGLIQQFKPTDGELAQVMGHEIAHALSNHTAEKMSVAWTFSAPIPHPKSVWRPSRPRCRRRCPIMSRPGNDSSIN